MSFARRFRKGFAQLHPEADDGVQLVCRCCVQKGAMKGMKIMDGSRVPERMTSEHLYVAVERPGGDEGPSIEWIWGRKTQDPTVVCVDTKMGWPAFQPYDLIRIERREPDAESLLPYWAATGEVVQAVTPGPDRTLS